MSSQPTNPAPYRVIPSPHVAAELRDFVRRARDAGRHQQVLTAVREIERILAIYPQYGEPLQDLHTTGETLYLMTIPPVLVKYVVDDTLRTVLIGTPFQALPHSGLK